MLVMVRLSAGLGAESLVPSSLYGVIVLTGAEPAISKSGLMRFSYFPGTV